ncbi:transglutaminase domain-containing protein [Clostridium paraputrificum]|uniref:transglutaminase domain-containing protein n=1 Tax=Clostridium paraputrificum TaxID=29363 RepID=UPI003D326E6C
MKGNLGILKKKIISLGIVISIIIATTLVSCSKGIDGDFVEDYKGYYNAIKDGLYNYDSTIVINVKNFDESVYNSDVVNKVLEDNIELIGSFDNYTFRSKRLISTSEIKLEFKYHDSKETLVSREDAVQKKVEDIVSEVIKPEMKDYEKEKALHDYVINNCKFDQRYYSGDMPKESYTVYGVLVNGIGVCQGYAIAMDKLLKAVGIETTIITGEALNNDGDGYIKHAWNIVEIGGENYHLDLTWDDPIMVDGGDKLRYSYFNITDEQIELNHKWDKNRFPQCTNTKYSFNNLNLVEKDEKGNDIVVVKDYNEFYSNIREDLSKKRKDKTYKIINFDGKENSIEVSINRAYESLSKSGEYSYAIETDEMTKCGYITVSLK